MMKQISKYDLTIGVLVLLLCAGFLLTSFQSRHAARSQQDCLIQKFGDLSVALNARSNLASRETAQNKALWLIYAKAAGIVKKQNPDHPDQALTPKQRAELNQELVSQLLTYRREITQIEKDRREHPVPPYPVGSCNGRL